MGARSPQTPESIDLKFDSDDYVGGLILSAKMIQTGPAEWRGRDVKYNVQLSYFFLLCLPSSGKHIFGSIAAFFALHDFFSVGIDFLGGFNIHFSYFFLNPPKPEKNLGPFSDLEKLQLKMLNA